MRAKTVRPVPATSPHPRPDRPSAGDPEAPLALWSPYGRWRALTLLLVLLLITAHVVHWRLAGKTLAPLELHEVMFTLEQGVVTAGFLFMALACVATAVFGRFFCSWGCHMMALQDGCAWVLRKVGLRPRPVRSRLLAFVPLGVLLYMFVWPQLTRLGEGRPFPDLRFAGGQEQVASFVTTNFWRNLPGPGIAGLTFLVCGALAVWVLGSRGFCQYGCPYGALFRVAERLAPGRVRVDSRCVQCGTCTKVCTSGVQVHEEVRRFGMVTDPRCVRDLDCVGACPEGALRFGFGRPALGLPRSGEHAVRRVFDFSPGEELILAASFLATVLVWRGLYNQVPFLMSVGLGGVAACLTVVLWRLATRSEVRLANHRLKQEGRLRPGGFLFVAAMAGFLLCSIHSGLIQFHMWRGRVALEAARATIAARTSDRGTPGDGGAAVRAALWHFVKADTWGLWPTVEARVRMAWLRFHCGELPQAEADLRAALAVDPRHVESRYMLGDLLERRGAREAAMAEFAECVRLAPERAPAHLRLGQLLCAAGRQADGEACLARAWQLDPRLRPAAARTPGGGR